MIEIIIVTLLLGFMGWYFRGVFKGGGCGCGDKCGGCDKCSECDDKFK